MTVQGINETVEMELKTKLTKKDRKESFSILMENANPVNKDESGNIVLSSCTIPLNMLAISDKYQRNHRKIKKLIDKWDPRKLMPITVVPDRENYLFYIVDGGGRYTVAPLKGLDKLSALVIMDAPKSAKERLKFEAEFFSCQGDEVEPLRKVDKHNAMVIAGDETAIALENTCKEYDVQLAAGHGQRRSGKLGSYSDVYNLAKSYGESYLKYAFGIIENAGWVKEKNGYSVSIMRTLKTAFAAHPEHREETFELLSNELRQMDPELYCSKARYNYINRGTKIACQLYIEDIICRELNLERRVFFEKKNIVIKKGA